MCDTGMTKKNYTAVHMKIIILVVKLLLTVLGMLPILFAQNDIINSTMVTMVYNYHDTTYNSMEFHGLAWCSKQTVVFAI